MSSIFFIFHNFNQLHQPIKYEHFENEFEIFYFVSIASIFSSPSIRVSSQANQTLFMKKRWSNDLCDVCLVLSYWLDDCFSQEFHCIFICLWNLIFFPKESLFVRPTSSFTWSFVCYRHFSWFGSANRLLSSPIFRNGTNHKPYYTDQSQFSMTECTDE